MANKGITEEDKRKTIKFVLKQQIERHKLNMIELEFSRKSENIKHEHEMERQRIKTAEIRKAQERKDFYYQQSKTNGDWK